MTSAAAAPKLPLALKELTEDDLQETVLPPQTTPRTANGVKENYKWNFFTWVVFAWILRFIKYFTPEKNLTPVPVSLTESEKAKTAYEKFESNWAVECQKPKPSVLRAWFATFGVEYLMLGWWKVVDSICIWFAAYWLIRQFIVFARDPVTVTNPPYNGYLLALGMILSSAARAFALNHLQSGAVSIGIRSKACFTSAVYSKTMKTKGQLGVGDIVALCSRDCDRIVNGLIYFHFLWCSLPEVLAIIALIAVEVQLAVLPGVGILLVTYPLQFLFGYLTNKKQTEMTEVSDERVNVMNGVLDAIKIVKYSVWEEFFSTKVAALRQRELALLKTITTIRTFAFMNSFATPVLVSLVCFATYFLAGLGTINAVTTFTVLSISNSLRYPFFLLPTTVKLCTGAMVAMGNIEKYLLREELRPTQRNVATPPQDVEVTFEDASFVWEQGMVVVPTIQNISFSIKGPGLVAVIGSIAAGKSSLIAAIMEQLDLVSGRINVAGRFGYVSQFAWLFNASLQENILFGKPYDEKRYKEVVRVCALERDLEMLVDGDLTEIAERGTNLSGGQRQRVNLARAVYSDYEIILLDDPLSAVDQKVGRHIFSECIKGFLANKTVIFVTHALQYVEHCDKIIVMDDGRVAEYGTPKELLAKEDGLLKHMMGQSGPEEEHESESDAQPGAKPAPLLVPAAAAPEPVTPAANPVPAHPVYLPDDDDEPVHAARRRGHSRSIVRAVDEQVADTDLDSGTAMRSRVASVSMMRSFQKSMNQSSFSRRARTATLLDTDTEILRRTRTSTVMEKQDELVQAGKNVEELLQEEARLNTRIRRPRIGTVVERPGEVHDSPLAPIQPTRRPRNESLIKPVAVVKKDASMDEAKKNQTLGYSHYFKQAPCTHIIFIIFTFVATHAVRLTSDVWMTSWTNNQYSQTTGFYVGIYAMLIGLFMLMLTLRGLLFSWTARIVAVEMHTQLFTRIMHATMGFFQRTPLARLVNVFATDQDNIDDLLADSLFNMLQFTPLLLGTVILIAIYLPYSLICFGGCFLLLVVFEAACDKSIQRLKKEEAIARPYAYSHVTATVQGIMTVRAFGSEQRFTEVFQARMDKQHNYFNMLYHVQIWMALHIDLLSSILVFLIGIIVAKFRLDGNITSSTVGLVLSNAMQLIVFVKWTSRAVAEVTARMSSIETSAFYANQTEEEMPHKLPDRKPSPNWPIHPTIQYDGVVMHYNKALAPALKRCTFTIKAGEKIGIIGRTGAGKSTLLNSLLRLYELSEGVISVGDADIAPMGLQDVRGCVSIIPQEPILFKGTIRSNLDPLKEHPDSALWAALGKVNLTAYVQNLQLKLEGFVDDYGVNLSVGQRQLLCTARALMRNAKILVMDEATASVDVLTDALLQDTVRTCFAECTVLTIAHRLRTVIDYDRIMVMEHGVILEFDVPHVLLQNPKSALSQFVEQTGPATATQLKQIAKEAYELKQAIGVSATFASVPHDELTARMHSGEDSAGMASPATPVVERRGLLQSVTVDAAETTDVVLEERQEQQQ
eukprot:TRINITY_DN5614_c0_g1_i1.p1 TRINITY_DN5614_c0_g1~~TRINITY_DN5614_c0_g1_i1.p1  ORF type:complete len:1527 (-),score=457.46 TRINITY_DN5614_c0_g1_i1:33-4613(-)